MGVISKIADGHGTSNQAKIGDEGELSVVVHPHPPINETVTTLPFIQFFTDNGTNTGSNNMIVNGSSTAIDFYISASETVDIYIKTVSVQISDPGARLDRFGALTALSSGVRFFYEEIAIGEFVIAEAIQTNLDFFRDASGGKGFGTGHADFGAHV